MGDTWGSTSVSQEAEEEGDSVQEPLMWFLWEEMGKAGQAGLGLAGLNNFSGLWSTEAILIVWYLALG